METENFSNVCKRTPERNVKVRQTVAVESAKKDAADMGFQFSLFSLVLYPIYEFSNKVRNPLL